MAYWWVSQNQTYRQERSGGFLWAPVANEHGLTFFHWATMNEVRPGDVIFSYVGGRIVSVSVARTAAYDSPRPERLGEGLWEDAGKKVEAEYRDLAVPLPVASVVDELHPLLPDRYSPLNRFGTGNQGYLFSVPPRVGRLLLERIGGAQPEQTTDVVEEAVTRVAVDTTERRALVLSRVGQGAFRDALMSLWGGRCAVTGLDIHRLLRASHIKPWRDSDNRERLDPYNGLLLSPAYDAAFDAGLVTFGEDGAIAVSAGLTPTQVERIGLDPASRIAGLSDGHLAYLGYHRSSVYFER
jgi:putative restriction endonuclease